MKSTRIEVRFIGKKVPINHLSDYESLKDLKLFNHLKTKLPSRKKFEFNRDKYTKKKALQFEKFLDEVDREGIHSARKTFNRSRAFSRTLEPILNECSQNLSLSKRWTKKIDEKIVKGLDIKKYLKKKVNMEMENAKNTLR